MIVMKRAKAIDHLLLSLCGLFSLAIYWGAFVGPYNLYSLTRQGIAPDLGMITGYSRLACWRYVGALAALFGLYGAGIHFVSRLQGRGPLWIVGVCGLAAALLLIWVYPYAASDVFLYIVRGRVLGIYGQNSLLVPPSAFPIEPYLPFPSEWADIPSPYAPLWEWTAAGLARLGDGSLLRSLLAFKGLGLVSYIGCMGVLAALLRLREPKQMAKGLLLFAWNPLVLLETHAMAHNDLYMAFFVLLALWLWERKGYVWALVSLVLGGLVKYVPFMLLPPALSLLWPRLGWRAWWRTASSAMLVSAILIALTLGPLWPGRAGLGVIGQMQRIHHSVAAWTILLLGKLASWNLAFDLGLWLMRASFLAAYMLILLHSLRRGDPPAHTYLRLLYAWLCLGATGFGYWYISWLIALIPFVKPSSRIQVIAFSFCGLSSVAIYTFLGLSSQQIHLFAVPFVFGFPFLATWLYNRGQRRQDLAQTRIHSHA